MPSRSHTGARARLGAHTPDALSGNVHLGRGTSGQDSGSLLPSFTKGPLFLNSPFASERNSVGVLAGTDETKSGMPLPTGAIPPASPPSLFPSLGDRDVGLIGTDASDRAYSQNTQNATGESDCARTDMPATTELLGPPAVYRPGISSRKFEAC